MKMKKKCGSIHYVPNGSSCIPIGRKMSKLFNFNRFFVALSKNKRVHHSIQYIEKNSLIWIEQKIGDDDINDARRGRKNCIWIELHSIIEIRNCKLHANDVSKQSEQKSYTRPTCLECIVFPKTVLQSILKHLYIGALI